MNLCQNNVQGPIGAGAKTSDKSKVGCEGIAAVASLRSALSRS